MKSDEAPPPSEAITPAERSDVNETSEEPPARYPGTDAIMHDPPEKGSTTDRDAASGTDGHPHDSVESDNVRNASGDPALLWTMDEETVLLHCSEASLKHIRTRLENLLLGVSHALRTRETRGDSQGPLESRSGSASRSGSTGRTKSRPVLDFAESVLVADHAVRRIVGEAFNAFEEDEVSQMAQLCSLADRGAGDCEALVRNAVVVLQALTHDGEAVRNVQKFREFVEEHREVMGSAQWRHDYVTAMRSMAVGFLREPTAIMASYGNSMNQIVEHEALYVGLLRLCGERPLGSTPHPKELAESLDGASLNLRPIQEAQSEQQHQQYQDATHPPATKTRTATAPKHNSICIHTTKNSSKRTHERRPSSTPQQHHQRPTKPSTEDLQNAMEGLMRNGSSSPVSPLNMSGSRQDSAAGPPPKRLHKLRKSLSHSDSTIDAEQRASASCARAKKQKPKSEPVPEVPRRLSLHNGKGTPMSHY
ncbi:hypothetical protein ABB37_01251 [Leptomonas pyrrhocoris]|uniref:Uncharacterized protein n=1 Tax=Leptomonas pyrrhocoris TaxID=157538 RepID=A0A0N0VH60_LEPPY|nr:hypothetical protein ABB37_01251 [Leptomonas pyrrhocoris]KPA84761.1 hypothetical protein ABB37_01251 [Leptomonas pyrrhocoris]|eukprot:XP_015663200.1 hypothetical protein ABB37_01251 [Leptomonas pyrrhocoris]